jgi:amino-acid N-acetyltransferase
MNARFDIRPALPADLSAVLALLAESGLPVADLTGGLPGAFFVAEDGGQLLGVAGVERLGEDGLLRSLAVAETIRGSGLGRRLVESCEVGAKAAGLANLYLLTTSADAFFVCLGYRLVPREDVPPAVAGHAQFRSLCPASAKCLHKRLA